MTFGTRLRNARVSLKFSQVDLSKKTGISQSAIAAYECSKRFPKPEMLIRLMKALNIDANYVYQDMMEEK